ncbi:hypothetical protein O6379_24230, partial [Salmonella enterica subsp. enterica]|uniref:hypothetical protein n=1 Tax=Salmonella enterica TaxID=28901 RepID=UPI0022B72CF8|nr:hypothetical protein [Salmonella enterica]
QLLGSVDYKAIFGGNALSVTLNGGALEINYFKPSSTLHLDFGPNENDVQINYVKTTYKSGFFGQPRKKDLYMTPALLAKTDQNKRITY